MNDNDITDAAIQEIAAILAAGYLRQAKRKRVAWWSSKSWRNALSRI